MIEPLENRSVLSTLTVTSLGDSGSGCLRNVVAAAKSGDSIVFSTTLFSSSEVTSAPKAGHGKPKPPQSTPNTITLTSGELALTKNLTIQGPGASKLTISGNYVSRVFEVAQGTTVILTGMTISKGWGAAYGGGILNNGTLTVRNSVLSNNGAQYGGGICNLGGTLTVGDSTLSTNYADGVAGGGIYNAGGTVTVSKCTLSGNSARYGGGVYNASGALTISDSTLSGNFARPDYFGVGGYGGGVYNSAGTVTISNSILSGNSAGVFGGGGGGGGVYNAPDGTLIVKNSSSITGNTGSFEGSAEDINNLGVLYVDSTSTIGFLIGKPAILI